MPIYEYRCATCGAEFDELQKVNDPPPPCPECSGEDVAKKVSRTSFRLKGGGWYKDLYSSTKPDSSSSSAGATSSSSSSSSSSESSSSSSSDSSSSGSGSSETKAAA